MFLEEKAWVSDDYRFATITNGFLSKSKFSFVLESKIVNHDKVSPSVPIPSVGNAGEPVQPLGEAAERAHCAALRCVRPVQERGDSAEGGICITLRLLDRTSHASSRSTSRDLRCSPDGGRSAT